MSKNLVRDGGRGEPGEEETLKEVTERLAREESLKSVVTPTPVTSPIKFEREIEPTTGPAEYRTEPGETAPPIGYDPKVVTGEYEVKTTQDAENYVRHMNNYGLHLESLANVNQNKIDDIASDMISVAAQRASFLASDVAYTQESLDTYNAVVDQYLQDANESVKVLSQNIDNLNEGISVVDNAVERFTGYPETVTTRTTYYTVTDPRTGTAAKFIEQTDAQRYRDNLVTELTMAKYWRITGETQAEWERTMEAGSLTSEKRAIHQMLGEGLIEGTKEGDIIEYTITNEFSGLSSAHMELAKTAGFNVSTGGFLENLDIEIVRGGATLGEIMKQTRVVADFDSLKPWDELTGTESEEVRKATMDRFYQDFSGTEWLTKWAARALYLAAYGLEGMIVGGSIAALYATAPALGLGLISYITITGLASMTTPATQKALAEYIIANPEAFIAETVGSVLGGYDVLRHAAAIRAGKARADQLYPQLNPEDFFVDEEVLSLYPSEIARELILEETIYVPYKTTIVDVGTVNPAELLSTGFTKGILYKMSTGEYGIVNVGEGTFVVKLDGLLGTPTVVFSPQDIVSMSNLIKHNPALILELNALVEQGVQLPGWMVGAGVSVRLLSPTELANKPITSMEVIIGQDGQVFFREVNIQSPFIDVDVTTQHDFTILEETIETVGGFPVIEPLIVPILDVDVIPIVDVAPMITELDPIQIEELKLDITPVVVPPISDVVVDIEEPVDVPFPIDPIERQVEEYKRKLQREGRTGIEGAVNIFRRGLKAKEAKRKKGRKQKKAKKNQSYRVYFVYPTGASEAQSVAAKKFREAYYIGNRIRKIKLHPKEIEIEFRGKL